MRARRTLLAALALAPLLPASGCVSVGLGGDPAAQSHLRLVDPGAGAVVRRERPLAGALLIQAQPADALADTLSIAYSRRADAFAFYQYASWTERPVRQLPRLLQQRLEARGTAGAVGLLGEPLRADWLLLLGVDTLHHDIAEEPGQARLALAAELFDRQRHTRVALRRVEATVPVARADSAAFAQAASQAVAQAFDVLVPWLEAELQRAGGARQA